MKNYFAHKFRWNDIESLVSLSKVFYLRRNSIPYYLKHYHLKMSGVGKLLKMGRLLLKWCDFEFQGLGPVRQYITENHPLISGWLSVMNSQFD